MQGSLAGKAAFEDCCHAPSSKYIVPKGENRMSKRLSNVEVSRRGHALYEHELRSNLETEENLGKIVVLDVETGHYEIDTDGIQASRCLRERYPDIDPYTLFAIRIGYDAVFAIGSTLTKTASR
jgi:hypothetical protein